MIENKKDPRLIPIETTSKQEWSGLHPQRFVGSIKTIKVKGELDNLNSNINYYSRKHFPPKFGNPQEYISSLKTFPDQYKVTLGKEEKQKGVRQVLYIPGQKQLRAERTHLKSQRTLHWEDFHLGIRTFSSINNRNSNKTYYLEDKMTRKKLVDNLEEKRNLLPIKSLGDKIYRHPDYSKDFFKEGGLIPGANIGLGIKKSLANSGMHLDRVKINKKLTWKEKERVDAINEDIKAVEEIELWEENVLKEANPNYRDPDTVEAEEIPNEDKKKDMNKAKKGKEAKKGKK